MMSIVVKELKPEVKSLSGCIVYVMAGNVAVEATVCKLYNVQHEVSKFKTKYKI